MKEKTMRNTQHTPGPWIAQGVSIPHENPKVGIIGIHTPKGDALAFDWDGSFKTKHEAEANAALIASAPELLDALENAYWHLDRVAAFVPGHTFPNEIMEALAKVISKAGGNPQKYED